MIHPLSDADTAFIKSCLSERKLYHPAQSLPQGNPRTNEPYILECHVSYAKGLTEWDTAFHF